MPDILHRISIDAPTDRVHDLIATTDGVAQWWTGRALDGSAEVGDRFGVYFGDADQPAAVMHVMADTPQEITWRVEAGPEPWIGTLITFTLRPNGADGTTLLFRHAGWQEASEFMSGSSLKTGAESGPFAPPPIEVDLHRMR